MTAPVRQLDVLIHALADYQEDMDQQDKDQSAQQLERLRDYLQGTRKEKQARLVESLKSPSFSEGIRAWQDHLEKPAQASAKQAAAESGKPVCNLVDEMIWDRFLDSKKHGKAFARNYKDEPRRALKQCLDEMGYLMEFFRSFYAVLQLRELFQMITALREQLQSLEQMSVQAEIIGECMQQQKDETLAEECGQLMNILQQRRESVIEQFGADYSAYSSASTRKKFKDLFIEYHSGKDSEDNSDL